MQPLVCVGLVVKGGNDQHMEASVLANEIQPNKEVPSESDLVHAAKQGDTIAFEELVRRYTHRVFRIAQHITHSSEVAQEVVQEVFLRVFRHIENFEERAKFSTWLTRVTVNTALTMHRPTRHADASLDENWQDEDVSGSELVPDWRPNPEQLYSRSELRTILEQALEQLPERYSTVFVLRDIEGLSIEETASALGLTPPAVKTRLLRARLQLRERLSAHFQSSFPEGRRTEHLRANLLPSVRPLGDTTVAPPVAEGSLS